LRRGILVVAIVLYAAFVIRTSWVSDDAFITLRVVDNTVHGFGPRWNVAERVQVFTHPLWFLALTPAYAVVREPYLTATALGWLASLAAIAVVAWRLGRRDPLVAAGAIGALALSRAYVDYSTSGLENPLTHLLLALFALDRDPKVRAGVATVAPLSLLRSWSR
jgi:arabinofuranosyltransferase